MKRIVYVAAIIAAATVFAEPNTTNTIKKAKVDPNTLTPEQNLARRMAARTKRFNKGGGRIARPKTLKGEAVIVNCQKRAAVAELEKIADYFRFETGLAISVRDGEFDLMNPRIQGNVSLFVIDDAKLPPVITAPDSRWAFVNVAPLAAGRGEKPAFFEARVRKQLSRGFAMLCGGAESQFPSALTTGIASVDDLDTHADYQLPVDVLARFRTYLKPFGVIPADYTSYRQACREGWAPEPANEVQKKIWDEVHSIPTKPIKIKP